MYTGPVNHSCSMALSPVMPIRSASRGGKDRKLRAKVGDVLPVISGAYIKDSAEGYTNPIGFKSIMSQSIDMYTTGDLAGAFIFAGALNVTSSKRRTSGSLSASSMEIGFRRAASGSKQCGGERRCGPTEQCGSGD